MQSTAELFSVAIQHHQAGRLRDAVAVYERLLALDPGHETAHMNAGIALFRLGHHTGAASHFQRALEINPGNPTARDNLALLTSVPFEVSRPPGLFYVGDLSRQDAHLLATLSRTAHRVLEFGVGASTLVLAQSLPPGGEIISLDTDPAWIEKVDRLLEVSGQKQKVRLLPYEGWQAGPWLQGNFDIVFNDGQEGLRPDFAAAAWKYVKIGGCMIFHDTRRQEDFGNVLRLLEQHRLEIDRVEFNLRASNLSVVTKKLAEPYQNWNVLERKEPWQFGFASLEETLERISPPTS